MYRLATIFFDTDRQTDQSCGLRPRSYDKTGLRPASVLVLVLYFWSCFQHCCAWQDAVIILKCNKHLCSFMQFWCFFAPSYFLIINMRAASCRRVFLCYAFLLLLNWSWSWSYNFGLVSITDYDDDTVWQHDRLKVVVGFSFCLSLLNCCCR